MKSISGYRLTFCQEQYSDIIDGKDVTIFICTNNLFIHKYIVKTVDLANQVIYPVSYTVQSIETGNIKKVI